MRREGLGLGPHRPCEPPVPALRRDGIGTVPVTLRRFAPMKPSAGTRWPAEVRAHIHEHQHQCLGPLAGMPGDCAGYAELDHVRAGGTGIKSSSVATNGARLCSWHHRLKTNQGRTYRPRLLSVIARLHGECVACQREAITEWGVPLEETP